MNQKIINDFFAVFKEYMIKEFNFIIKIDMRTRRYILAYSNFEDTHPYPEEGKYDDFIRWWIDTFVVGKDETIASLGFDLENMISVLRSGEVKGQKFCTVNGPNNKQMHIICTYCFYGNDLNSILFFSKEVGKIKEEEIERENLSQRLLYDAFEEIKRTKENQSQLLEHIVNELEEPISTIRELFVQDRSHATRAMINHTLDYLVESIRSIKEYNRINNIQIVTNQDVNLYDFCYELSQEFHNLCSTLKIDLKWDIKIPQDQKYDFSDYRVREIIRNVMGNAIKYTPIGSTIIIDFRELIASDGSTFLDLYIEDGGPFIQDNTFVRANTLADQDFAKKVFVIDNMGDSLMLANRIAGMIEGNIAFRKGTKDNSIIMIKIPIVKSSENADKDIPKPQEQLKEMIGRSILVVEHGDVSSSSTVALLHANGAKVYDATTGRQALMLLEKFSTGVISAVLVDRELEDMTAIEFATALRSNSKFRLMKNVPIIEMVGKTQAVSIKSVISGGINAIIEKPVNLKKLARIIQGFGDNWE
ncbi:MAG: response regulator [Eubacterium sp.]|nr:response regulator [Eubacterium sp.]